MGHIKLKTILKFNMNQVGQFLPLLVYGNVFVQNRKKLTLLGKMLATTEISSELMETTYFHQT